MNAPSAPVRRLRRRHQGRLVAGVAGGLANHLGVDVLLVRLVFIALAAAGGSGIVMYALFWVFAPLDDDTVPEPDETRDLAPLVALGALILGALLLLTTLGVGLSPQVALPLFALGFGVVILWRQADDRQRARLLAVTGARRRSGAMRAAAGVVLVVIGGAAILYGSVELNSGGEVLLAVLALTGGVALLTGPWWMQMARELSAERSARIRAQERAEIAAHVHDSVLHTLTLIQRHVTDPREVARLARAQERELRGWLYRPANGVAATARSALERVAAEVEDAHGVEVRVVIVGDCPVDEPLSAVVQATREALVNAAKYAPEEPISLYAEVEPEQVTVFVRDRGTGFDIDAIPADRMGVRESVVGRMARNGGTAIVRSAPEAGTEVQLQMPRRTS